MFCPKCGKEIPDTAKFCSGCGTQTIKTQAPVQQQKTVQQPKPQTQPQQPVHQPKPQTQPQVKVKQPVQKPPKKENGGNKGVLIGIIVALAVVVIGLVGFIVSQNVVNNNKPATGNSVAQSSSVAKNSSSKAQSSTVQSSTEPSSSVAPAERDYIIPDSSTRIISESEISNLTKEELRLARNEIYARHGRKFQDEELQKYFDSKSWYRGTIEPKDFTDNMLSDIEKNNKDLIVKMEQR